jgi:streptomycin 6-kinase
VTLVPADSAQVIARRFGAAGERFLRELPERLAGVAARWRLALGEPLPIGIGGYLVAARTAEGADAVLKLSPTGGEQDRANALEAWALERWYGEGAVALLRADHVAGALLLERCVPGTTIDVLGDDDMVRSGCAVALALHRAPDLEDRWLLRAAADEVALRAGAFGDVMARIGGPLSAHAESVVAAAHEELAAAAVAPVVCHGDLNPGNLLAAQRVPWLAIDPLPVIAPAAYDAASLVWAKRPWLLEQPDAAAVLVRRIELAADALDASPHDVWAWTLARATGMLAERAAWGGHDDALVVAVVELLSRCGV